MTSQGTLTDQSSRVSSWAVCFVGWAISVYPKGLAGGAVWILL